MDNQFYGRNLSPFSAFHLITGYNHLLNTEGIRYSTLSPGHYPNPAYRLPSQPSEEIKSPITLPLSLISPYHRPISSFLQGESAPNLLQPAVCPRVSPRRQRSEKKPIPDEQKDDKYFERRRRNNQAAKKSRDARKIREDQVAMRAAILEHENAILRAQVLTLREEASSLRQILMRIKSEEESSTKPKDLHIGGTL